MDQFLKSLRKRANAPTVTKFFEQLGGKKNLGITLRHFQMIESGKQKPSAEFISRLFEQVDSEDRKPLLVTFFKSINGENSSIANYIDENWMPTLPAGKEKFYQKSIQNTMTYNDEQLDYLLTHSREMRFHKSVMLRRELDAGSVGFGVDLTSMERLDLISRNGDKIRPSRNAYVLPHPERQPSRLVSKATDYILKHIDLYISKEGGREQELIYALQWLPEEIADAATKYMLDFKKWLLTHATDPGESSRPVITVGFIKKLHINEV